MPHTNVDDLSGIVEQGHRARKEASRQLRKWYTPVIQFVRLMSDVEMGPMISSVTEKVESIARKLLRSKFWTV